MGILIMSSYDDRRVIQLVLGNYDAPAFVRRASRVQEALDSLLARCRQERDRRLAMPRLRLGLLGALAGNWNRLRPLLANEQQITVLQELEIELSPRLRVRVNPTLSERKLLGAIQALRQSLEYFNGRWFAYLAPIDLTAVNAAREGYNRYYLLEKECALGSPRLARQGYRSLPAFTLDELKSLLPVLPIPEINVTRK
jgi:hypothetical protein